MKFVEETFEAIEHFFDKYSEGSVPLCEIELDVMPELMLVPGK
jgi:hypothetical protein